MGESVLIAGSGTSRITREELARITTPEATRTHKPVPHIDIVNALIETLGFRHILVGSDEYAVSPDGMKMFGLLELNSEFNGCKFAIGLRNAHDKSMRLALTVGYRVMVCSNMAFKGDFSPVLAKHSRSFDLVDALSIGVDRIQRNFDGLIQQVRLWKDYPLDERAAKTIIYDAFVEGSLALPHNLLKAVHRHYFHPQHEAFIEPSMWSLSNAFTSAFKGLKPFNQFRATAKLNPFLERYIGE